MEHDQPTPATHRPPLSESEAAAEARRIIAEAYREPSSMATSYRDPTPTPAIGPTPPVAQPDQRIVPAWAAGVAVASIGVGAGITGLGCGAWLLLKGLAAVTLWGVLAVVAPFAGIAMVATAIGAAIAIAKASTSQHIYQGTVINNNEVTTHTRGLLFRNRTELHN
ncbi:hypothetical protein [Streptomyces sp. NPDC053048]|uniref:hypothetical protein n=1 Tax=Streptomyces sp. NPDC053048 TaxID=3365694 RepID=UPI0037CF6D37